MSHEQLPEASVHGRFQPFHNEHLEYLLEAKRRCGFLWIGIVRFDVVGEATGKGDGHRFDPRNNPLTYFERLQMIRDALLAEDINQSEFGFIPFPIDEIARLPQFLPTSVHCFTTICEDWNREKISRLKDAGYSVEVLIEREDKSISGEQIRSMMVLGDTNWKELVPNACVKSIEVLELPERLKS